MHFPAVGNYGATNFVLKQRVDIAVAASQVDMIAVCIPNLHGISNLRMGLALLEVQDQEQLSECGQGIPKSGNARNSEAAWRMA